MDMSMPSATVTTAAAAAKPTMPSMGMSMGPGACKISMLWNWYTIDSCFIARTWHIRTRAAFGGSCIGVILLVLCLELLRRVQREYDRYITRTRKQQDPPSNGSGSPTKREAFALTANIFSQRAFRPTIPQQLVRSLLYMLQFAVAYFIMLLAMYYNGELILPG
ncbi:hypothetical protein GP486_007559 [Trichoglossum hirsutum]|uniref:Copper transport protein n=1 Tax=Trichoglossum hirsutum TaxID=265104 RepID=A0A9P8IJD7_9PEZI|nr:hypothetical protein GP486_007559 [Trichoglossum hirsutum]